MKYYDEDMLRDTFGPEECEFFFNRHKGYELKIRFCRDCKYFECDGIQPEPGVIHGRCLYYTTEPPYLRVTDKNFCNEDNIIGGK